MSSERRAVLILLSLALAGQGIRYLASRPGDAPGDIQLLGGASSRTAVEQAQAAVAAHRPLKAGEKIDADRAGAQELARLPRVGFALAQRIVSDRDSLGAFGSLEGLDRVSGIGPGLLKAIAPHLSFSGTARGQDGPRAGRQTGLGLSANLPTGQPAPRVNLNTASADDIERLPLIGPARALAIVGWRERHGSFKNLDDLVLVPGVSRRMAEAIRHLVAF